MRTKVGTLIWECLWGAAHLFANSVTTIRCRFQALTGDWFEVFACIYIKPFQFISGLINACLQFALVKRNLSVNVILWKSFIFLYSPRGGEKCSILGKPGAEDQDSSKSLTLRTHGDTFLRYPKKASCWARNQKFRDRMNEKTEEKQLQRQTPLSQKWASGWVKTRPDLGDTRVVYCPNQDFSLPASSPPLHLITNGSWLFTLLRDVSWPLTLVMI